MKIVRDGNQRLELVAGNYLLPGWFILLGGGGFIHELIPYLTKKQHFTDFKSAVPLLVAALFLVVGLALFRRYSCTFDVLQQQATWKTMGLLGRKTRVVSFSQIKGVELEADPNNFANQHPQWGPPSRLVLLTTEGPLPFSDMYMTCGQKEKDTQAAINEFLGQKPVQLSVDDQIRALVARGQSILAIKMVREQQGCSLAKAKEIVDQMR